MNKLFLIIIILIFLIYLFKSNKESFNSRTWGFGMFEIPFFSITMTDNKNRNDNQKILDRIIEQSIEQRMSKKGYQSQEEGK